MKTRNLNEQDDCQFKQHSQSLSYDESITPIDKRITCVNGFDPTL